VAAIKKISPLLAAASSSLLAPAADAQSVYENDWNVDFGYLRYSEEDRIKVNTLTTTVDGRLSDEDKVSFRLAVDSMSGATPTGETPTENGAVFSGASGGSSSTSSSTAGLINFDDTRLEFDGNWENTKSRLRRNNYNAYISVESDYNAIGASYSYIKDNADKTKTLTLGAGASYDTITGAGGGTPRPHSATNNNISLSEGNKNTYDFLLGFTKVINAKTVSQVNYSLSHSEGYLTDPYKRYSRLNNNATSTTAFFESRPEERNRLSVSWKVKHQTRKNNNLTLGARLYSDDWDVSSLTFDYKHRFNKFNGNYLERQVRFYTQSEASFYKGALQQAEATPEFISADSRLGSLSSLTLGFKYGMLLKNDARLTMRLSYFYQTIDDAFFDENKALNLDIGYSLKFE